METKLSGVIAAYRILLVPSAQANEGVVLSFAVPQAMVAVKESVDVFELLVDAGRKVNELTRIFVLETGADLSAEGDLYKLVSPTLPMLTIDPALKDAQEAPADLQVRSDRILWRPDISLVVCNAERLNEILIALVYFSYFSTQVARLENELSVSWGEVRKDMRLLHQIDERALAEQPRINEKTRWSYGLRADYARIEPFIDTVPNYVPANARRIIQELATHTEILGRLKALDDQLEVFEDTYELANDRILEFSYFRGEYKLEVVIIVVLLVELLLSIFEHFV